LLNLQSWNPGQIKNSWLTSALAIMIPFLKVVKALVVFVFMYVISQGLCNLYVNDLYYTKNAFISFAFPCFKKICEPSHESLRLRWHPGVNDCVEHSVFGVIHMRSFVTRESCDITIVEVKVEVVCKFLVNFCMFMFLHLLMLVDLYLLVYINLVI
jgi:hypothetical protein